MAPSDLLPLTWRSRPSSATRGAVEELARRLRRLEELYDWISAQDPAGAPLATHGYPDLSSDVAVRFDAETVLVFGVT
jgi:hypothetical protein